MKTMYHLATAFVCAVLMLGYTLQVSAQSATQRMVVIEEYTSATCTPCVNAEIVLKPIVKLSNGVIAVRYHLFYPTPGDPFYAANKTENDVRSRYYYGSNPPLPAARVNGHYDVSPQISTDVINAVKLDQAQPYPVKIAITHDKTDANNVKVGVTVTSDIALNNYTLQTIVTAHDIILDKLPLLPDDYTETLEHWNGVNEFSDAMLKILPDTNGTQVSLSAGETKTYNFTYTAKKGDIWKFDELTIVAFLQNNATGEIIQGATTVTGQVGSMVNTTLSFTPSVEPVFLAANPNESAETKIVIGNVGAAPMKYTGLSITKASRTPSDWNMTVDSYSPDFTVEPGKTKEINVKLTRGTSTGSGAVDVSFKEEGGNTLSAIPITIVAKETDGFIVIDNPAKKNEPFASAITARSTKKNYAEISPQHVQRYYSLFPNLRRMLWNEADSGVVDIKDFAYITSMMNRGISMLISGQRNSYEAYFNGVRPMLDTFGLTFTGTSRINPFTLTGYTGDAISDGFSESCSITGTYPLYKLSLVKPTKSGVTPFLAIGDTIAAVRYQASNARMIYMGFNPAIIQNTTSRNTMLDKAITWLEASTFTPLAKLSAVDTIDFGIVASSKEKEVELTNVGNIPYTISEVSFIDNKDSYFSVVSNISGTTIEPGAKKTVAVKFTDKLSSGQYTFESTLQIKSSDPNAQTLSIILRAILFIGGVNEGVIVPSLTLLAQPNPASEALHLSYSTVNNNRARLQLFDMLGREVRLMELGELSAGDYSSTIETSDLPIGLYSIVLTAGNKRVQTPIMIVR